MTDTIPQITLITPAEPATDTLCTRLAAALDAVPVACLRLRQSSQDPAVIARSADLIRPLAHERDIALVIDTHTRLAASLGLDGVHLLDGARSVAAARKELGEDAIVGAFCEASTHDGMTAGERGADYVTFGPVTDQGLGSGTLAEPDLFAWWSQMIELPVVAEGGLTPDAIRALAPVTDFFAIGDEIWHAEDPARALQDLHALIREAAQ